MSDVGVIHFSPELARERGYMGNTRTVRCVHIRSMVTEAMKLVNRVDQATFPEPAPGGEVEAAGPALVTMERAINLLQHAAAELEDERLRLRDGWPA